jgi:hypothetical protein
LLPSLLSKPHASIARRRLIVSFSTSTWMVVWSLVVECTGTGKPARARQILILYDLTRILDFEDIPTRSCDTLRSFSARQKGSFRLRTFVVIAQNHVKTADWSVFPQPHVGSCPFAVFRKKLPIDRPDARSSSHNLKSTRLFTFNLSFPYPTTTPFKMADDDEDIAALVVDNGSGMCKGKKINSE